MLVKTLFTNIIKVREKHVQVLFSLIEFIKEQERENEKKNTKLKKTIVYTVDIRADIIRTSDKYLRDI